MTLLGGRKHDTPVGVVETNRVYLLGVHQCPVFAVTPTLLVEIYVEDQLRYVCKEPTEMLSIYAPPTFDEATRTLGIWLTFHKPPSRTVPATLRQKGDRNYRVCLGVYAGQEQTARIGEWNCTFRRRAAKDTDTSWLDSLFEPLSPGEGNGDVVCADADTPAQAGSSPAAHCVAQASDAHVSSMPLSTPPAAPLQLSAPYEGKVTVTLATPCGWVCFENEMLFMLDRQNGASIRSCEASFLFFDTQACVKRPVAVQGGSLRVVSPIVERPQRVQVMLLCDSQPQLQQISFVYTYLAL